MQFKRWFEARSNFLTTLMTLRPQMAAAAQKVYNSWQQDEDGMDVELGGGGICQDIAEEIANLLNFAGHDAMTVSSSCGEQHVWCVAYNDHEAYEIDIPYHTYETGGGYNWKKKEGVVFRPQDISIHPIDRSGVEELGSW